MCGRAVFVIVCPTAISAVRPVRFETSREIFGAICERPSFATLKNSRHPCRTCACTRVAHFFFNGSFSATGANGSLVVDRNKQIYATYVSRLIRKFELTGSLSVVVKCTQEFYGRRIECAAKNFVATLIPRSLVYLLFV